MIVGALASSLKGLIAVAQGVTAVRIAADVGRDINHIKNRTTSSLTQYTNQTTLRSRVYIDDAIARDPVVVNLLRAAHTMYTGMILNALQLQNLVSAGRTVKDSLSVVRTSSSFEAFDDIMPKLDQLQASLESMDPQHASYLIEETEKARMKKIANDTINPPKTEAEELEEAQRKKRIADAVKDKPMAITSLASRDITPAPAEMFPVGKLIDVTLTNPDHPEASQNVTLLVQMLPYLIKSEVMDLILTVGTSLTLGQRWAQFKAGEIAFWRDLVFQVDRLQHLEKATRSDKSGVFADYLRDVSKKDTSRIGQIFTAVAGKDKSVPSSNISNSVIVVSEDALLRAKANGGVDLENEASREKFFSNTYAMMVFVVDQAYNQVTLYMNGISDIGHYSFDQFLTKKGFDAVDVVGLLQGLSQNRAPRF